ncbi:hypothetical protein [Psychrobacter phenylpyruvicus]|uniref:Uncharacterized protein n=1 Tax=Psychrobacter phenylpyruvicus TaxID=29432 RepID=A0A379LNV7_9GAMM|nr:hypothetical protein [Psychrobacter phenylpyruvicus]SUD91454.1 Uncharacterised protein [Psychrobacter phenylpyruvicus]
MCEFQTLAATAAATNSFQYTPRYKPKCPLAALAVQQIISLQLRSADIVKSMGYPKKHTFAATDRLRYVLCSKNLGLDGSYIDPFYSADEFVIELFAILQIKPDQYQQEVKSILHTLQQPT